MKLKHFQCVSVRTTWWTQDVEVQRFPPVSTWHFLGPAPAELILVTAPPEQSSVAQRSWLWSEGAQCLENDPRGHLPKQVACHIMPEQRPWVPSVP